MINEFLWGNNYRVHWISLEKTPLDLRNIWYNIGQSISIYLPPVKQFATVVLRSCKTHQCRCKNWWLEFLFLQQTLYDWKTRSIWQWCVLTWTLILSWRSFYNRLNYLVRLESAIDKTENFHTQVPVSLGDLWNWVIQTINNEINKIKIRLVMFRIRRDQS